MEIGKVNNIRALYIFEHLWEKYVLFSPMQDKKIFTLSTLFSVGKNLSPRLFFVCKTEIWRYRGGGQICPQL